MIKKIFQGSALKDPSLWFLLLSNLITIFLAISQGWNLLAVMWIYWFQSIIIGFFNFIRIFQLKEFSIIGLKIGDQLINLDNFRTHFPVMRTSKMFFAFFFLFHYGGFHLVYLAFLLTGVPFDLHESGVNFEVGAFSGLLGHEMKLILLAALIFFINHLFSYIYNKPRDTKKQNIGELMLYPYARVIPMHFTIILGSALGSALIFFLLLKTFADCAMHITEHKIFRKGNKDLKRREKDMNHLVPKAPGGNFF